MKGKRKNDINIEDCGEMKGKGGEKVGEVGGRWKGKGGRKIEKVVENGKEERKVEEV